MKNKTLRDENTNTLAPVKDQESKRKPGFFYARKAPGLSYTYGAIYMRKHRKEVKGSVDREYQRKHHKEMHARKRANGSYQAKMAVYYAIQKGVLPSLKKNLIPCSDCGERATQYDHRDYNKPLDVSPVCLLCNQKRGKGISRRGKVLSPKLCAFLLVLTLVSAGLSTPLYARNLIASWYYLPHKIMANGKEFKNENFTCASWLYPLGTRLSITCIQTGKSVIVEVTDRINKRYTKTRIDLPRMVFGKLDRIEKGIIPIRVKRIRP